MEGSQTPLGGEGDLPTSRADVEFVLGATFSPNGKPQLGVVTKAPAGSSSEAAGALMLTALGGGAAALAIAAVCLWAGASPEVTIGLAMLLFVVMLFTVIWVIVRNDHRSVGS